VTPADGEFAFHDQAFQFGPTELKDMILFYATSHNKQPGRKTKGR
jgi:hypothetical protein